MIKKRNPRVFSDTGFFSECVMDYSETQKKYMKRALDLAEKARGFTQPNPLVGAVIVRDGEIVGEGYHHRAGEPHAEINAISEAKSKAMGATMYVTLEPCAHYGKTPPCANALVRAGIKEVFIALEDPNPKVSGKGVAILQEAGIIVHTGLLREEAIRLNRIFLTNQIKRRAFIALKSAQSIDGKIGPPDGHPLKITSDASHYCAHLLRRDLGAVLVGVNTVIKDDPALNIRYDIPHPENSPVRIVIDPRLRLPLNGKIWHSSTAPVLIYTLKNVSSALKKRIESRGGNIVSLPDNEGKIDPLRIAVDLLERDICSVLIEGGAATLTEFFKAGLWDEYHCFIAPKFIGADGIGVFQKNMENNIEPFVLNAEQSVEICGEDTHIIYKNRQGVELCLPESSRKKAISGKSDVIHLVRR